MPEDEASTEARQLNKEAKEIYWANDMALTSEVAEIEMSLARLCKVNTEHPEDQVQDSEKPGAAFSHLVEAIDIYEFCLGFDHPETGEAYSRMGLACQEAGNYRGASLWLRRAFCVFFKSLGAHDEVTVSTHQQISIIDVNLQDNDLHGVPYEKLPEAIV